MTEEDREEECKSDKLHKIIDGIGDILFVMDKNRVIIEVNKSTCDIFKKKPEELIDKHCYEIVHGTNCPWPSCPATKTFETKQTTTEEVNDPNLGIPLLITTSPILDEQGNVTQVIHVAKDISLIKLAETDLHIAANLFDIASDSILVHDLDGKIIYFNEAAYKTRGFTRTEFQALSIQDLEVPNNPRFFGEKIKNLFEKGEATFETVNLRKDKKVLPVEIHARVFESDGRKLILSIARDISERKKDEEKLKESSRKIEMMNEKLHVVGSLTRHDVRNKLSTITGYSYILKKRHADQTDIVEGLDKMVQAVNSSVKIFDFAKMYEQLGVEELSLIEVKNAVYQAMELFSEPLKFTVINECNGLNLLADSFLSQMFYNLMDNTRKYGEKATTVRIYYENADGGPTKLIYEDDGVGISAENKVHLFKEGFTTGGSTGFGLFLIKKMMEVYGWTIEENGELGKGVKFQITIPNLNSNLKSN